MQVLLENYRKELDKEIVKMTVNKKIRKLHQDFEQLCFDMSKLDGTVSMDEFKSMTVYKFYRYKELLINHTNRKSKRKSDDD